jgi:hypothetical protein
MVAITGHLAVDLNIGKESEKLWNIWKREEDGTLTYIPPKRLQFPRRKLTTNSSVPAEPSISEVLSTLSDTALPIGNTAASHNVAPFFEHSSTTSLASSISSHSLPADSSVSPPLISAISSKKPAFSYELPAENSDLPLYIETSSSSRPSTALPDCKATSPHISCDATYLQNNLVIQTDSSSTLQNSEGAPISEQIHAVTLHVCSPSPNTVGNLKTQVMITSESSGTSSSSSCVSLVSPVIPVTPPFDRNLIISKPTPPLVLTSPMFPKQNVNSKKFVLNLEETSWNEALSKKGDDFTRDDVLERDDGISSPVLVESCALEVENGSKWLGFCFYFLLFFSLKMKSQIYKLSPRNLVKDPFQVVRNFLINYYF